METRRWFNPAQPQTLQIALFLLYINAAFALLFLVLSSNLDLLGLSRLAGVAAGFGLANERKWGYFLAIGVAVTPLVLRLAYAVPLSVGFIGLMFDVALVALLVHPQSRDYQRIWFK